MKKRRDDNDDIPESPSGSPSRKIARLTEDLLSPSSSSLDEEPLQWEGVFTSILGVEDISSGHDDEVHSDDIRNVLGQQFDDTVNNSPERSALADLGRRIETWAEQTVDVHQNSTIQEDNAQRCILTQAREMNDDCTQCFGMIHGCAARLMGDMHVLNIKLVQMSSRTKWAVFQISITSSLGFLILEDDTNICGQLSDNLGGPLQRICQIANVRLNCCILIADCLKCIGKANKQRDSIIQVDVNVYGPSTVREHVGQILSSDRLYLQHPKYRDTDFDYQNPHMLDYEDLDLQMDAGEIEELPQENADPDHIQKSIMAVCEAETWDRDGQEEIRDIYVKTELKPHQRSAVQFMVGRETGSIAESFKLWQYTEDETRIGYRHRVTGLWTTQPGPEMGGGILADDMGMGKTLSTLSLISKRRLDGWTWSRSQHVENGESPRRKLRTKATLVVLSSLLIMDEWRKDIETHLGSSLKWFKYHGKGRQNYAQSIFDSDIVLTTYHTLAIERRTRKGCITSVEWFRIVLDEAHTIRRQATTLYAAVAELHACHRWCLTGTPIQNKLDDLGALLAFIRMEPFDRTSVFRKYVVTPFWHDQSDAKDKLSLLLNSVCIRRKIERLKLPAVEHICRRVELSKEERLQYTQTLESMSWRLTHGSREKYSETPFGKFQIQLQLRRLCNHGTFQKPFASGQDDLQTQSEDIVSWIGKDGELRCSRCNEKTLVLATNCTVSRDLPCKHILCNGCIGELSDDSVEAASGVDCSYCFASSENVGRPSSQKADLLRHRRDFNESGYSSKMEQLMKDVGARLAETKSIIFSTWTRSLDLVECLLKRRDMVFTRIDGDTGLHNRQAILDEFAMNESVQLLLMTTGTGAYGLNLTVANRIFLLEPQWNPSIETQAIARAQRLLQSQRVQVFRYIVRASVEEDIEKQQGRKLYEADLGFRKRSPAGQRCLN
jgi:SWI/SNF-related matrix-associated actin-dependent regulator of chromatin subfamily A3